MGPGLVLTVMIMLGQIAPSQVAPEFGASKDASVFSFSCPKGYGIVIQGFDIDEREWKANAAGGMLYCILTDDAIKYARKRAKDKKQIDKFFSSPQKWEEPQYIPMHKPPSCSEGFWNPVDERCQNVPYCPPLGCAPTPASN